MQGNSRLWGGFGVAATAAIAAAVLTAGTDGAEAQTAPTPSPPSPTTWARSTGYRHEILRVARRHRDDVSTCAETHFDDGPCNGRIVIRFAILPDGRVADVAQDSSPFPTRGFAECIMSRMRAWRFPPPGRRLEVRYPYHAQCAS